MSLDDPDTAEAARQMVASLGDLERFVLECVAHGVSNEQIAILCKVSPAAISATFDGMMRKLDAQTTADAVRIAVRAGLGSPHVE